MNDSQDVEKTVNKNNYPTTTYGPALTSTSDQLCLGWELKARKFRRNIAPLRNASLDTLNVPRTSIPQDPIPHRQ